MHYIQFYGGSTSERQIDVIFQVVVYVDKHRGHSEFQPDRNRDQRHLHTHTHTYTQTNTLTQKYTQTDKGFLHR